MRKQANYTKMIEYAQRADRNRPSLAPGTEYYEAGSRFATLMHLARTGASNEKIKNAIPNIDSLTIRVARKLAEEEKRPVEISRPRTRRYGELPRLLSDLFERGYTPMQAADQLRCSYGSAYLAHGKWRQERRRDEKGCA